ncbi:hypothetical protein C7974DRAFT_456496 [Boeremia exigua]|uniref:uncharacterized protein n=1 Tax=Boeremia exigua TaxID=749465 RepID=UPI001E8E7192|nr:uncharacterized protein C7974DRAFT_456496 [Boeremia exigua]KAH6621792.1 hypothetical protein C7974DRAFT_456496 [Boeremia exigua]
MCGKSIMSRLRRSGHLVELYCMLWQPEVLDWPDSSTDREVILQAHIEKHYGITFTISSIRKMRKCISIHVSWAVAFLDCRRRDGGIVGIILQQDTYLETYNRLHWPSLVETVKPCFANPAAHEACTIHIMAHMVDCETKHSENRTDISDEVTYRPINLHDFGLSRAAVSPPQTIPVSAEYSAMDVPNIPRIVFTFNGADKSEELGVYCTLLEDTDTATSVATSIAPARRMLPHLARMDHGRTSPGQARFLVPIRRGSTTRINLNEDLRLMIRGQMRWRRNPLGRSREKQCQLSLSIDKRKSPKYDLALLDEGLYKLPLFSAPV